MGGLESNMPEELKKFVDSLSISYELLGGKAKSAEEAEANWGVKIEDIVKSLVLRNDAYEFIGVIVQGNKRVKLGKLKKLLKPFYKDNHFRLAEPSLVEKASGFKVGSVTPFAFAMKGIDAYVDKPIMDKPFVVGAAGREDLGIKFSPKVFEKLGYKVLELSE